MKRYKAYSVFDEGFLGGFVVIDKELGEELETGDPIYQYIFNKIYG